MTWKLQAITGEITGQEINVDRDMLVGRHQDADVLLQAAEISRRHAALLLKDQALWVQDLNSSNGTFVNDIRIEQEKQLHDGDIVQFASFKFSVLAPAQKITELPEIEAEPVNTTSSPDLSDQGMPSSCRACRRSRSSSRWYAAEYFYSKACTYSRGCRC